jgi:hypothetical protein
MIHWHRTLVATLFESINELDPPRKGFSFSRSGYQTTLLGRLPSYILPSISCLGNHLLSIDWQPMSSDHRFYSRPSLDDGVDLGAAPQRLLGGMRLRSRPDTIFLNAPSGIGDLDGDGRCARALTKSRNVNWITLGRPPPH